MHQKNGTPPKASALSHLTRRTRAAVEYIAYHTHIHGVIPSVEQVRAAMAEKRTVEQRRQVDFLGDLARSEGRLYQGKALDPDAVKDGLSFFAVMLMLGLTLTTGWSAASPLWGAPAHQLDYRSFRMGFHEGTIFTAHAEISGHVPSDADYQNAIVRSFRADSTFFDAPARQAAR